MTRYWFRTDPRAVLAWHGCSETDASHMRALGFTELDETAFRVLVRETVTGP